MGAEGSSGERKHESEGLVDARVQQQRRTSLADFGCFRTRRRREGEVRGPEEAAGPLGIAFKPSGLQGGGL